MVAKQSEILLGDYDKSRDFATLKEATQKLSAASHGQFDALKQEQWFSRLFDMVTFSNAKGVRVAEQISSLAQAQNVFIELLTQLSTRDVEVASLVEQSLDKLKKLTENDLLLAKRLKRLEHRVAFGLKDDYNLDALKGHEKQLLSGLLTHISQRLSDTTDAQQKYANAVLQRIGQQYVTINVTESIEALDSRKARKMLFSCFLEYLYLYDCSFAKVAEFQDLVDNFDLGRKSTESLKERVVRIHHLRGTEGLAQKYRTEEDDLEELLPVAIEVDPVEASAHQREDLVISSIVTVRPAEERNYEHKVVVIETELIKCEGTLRFESCEIRLGDVLSQIELSDEGVLEFTNCTIKADRALENYFIAGDGQVSIKGCSISHAAQFIECDQLLIEESNFSFQDMSDEESSADEFPIVAKYNAVVEHSQFTLSIPQKKTKYFEADNYTISNSSFEAKVESSNDVNTGRNLYALSGSVFWSRNYGKKSLGKRIVACQFDNLCGCFDFVDSVTCCVFDRCHYIFNFGGVISHKPRINIEKNEFINCESVFSGGHYECVGGIFESCSSPISDAAENVKFQSCRFNNLTVQADQAAFSFYFHDGSEDSAICDCVFDHVTFSDDDSRLAKCSIDNSGIRNKKPTAYFVKIKDSSLFKSDGVEPGCMIDTQYFHSGVFKDSYETGIYITECKGMTADD